MLVKEWFTVMLLIFASSGEGRKEHSNVDFRDPRRLVSFFLASALTDHTCIKSNPGVSYLCRLFSHLFLTGYGEFGINTDVDAWNRCETDCQMTACPGCSALDTLFPWSTGSRYGFSESMRGVTCGLQQPRKSGLPYLNHLHEWF